jgi:hypothetical protein
MRKLLLALAIVSLPVSAQAKPARTAPAPVRLPGTVVHEMLSWGKVLTHWQVNPDGTGEIWRRENAVDRDKFDIAHYRLRLDDKAMRTFVAAIEKMRVATRTPIRCNKTIFDLPYGYVNWNYPGGTQTYRFDAGCRSKAGDIATSHLRTADIVVRTMATVDTAPFTVDQVGTR